MLGREPVVMESPSGEVRIVVPATRRGRWRLEVRGVVRRGRGYLRLLDEMEDVAAMLDRNGLGTAAGELRHVAALHREAEAPAALRNEQEER